MKRLLVFLLLIQAGLATLSAQSASYLWPVKDAEPGTGIVSAPQGYIGDEFNFDHLFITAPEGTAIVAPADGTISSFGVEYRTGIQSNVRWSFHGEHGGGSYDENIEAVKDQRRDIVKDIKYLQGTLGIQMPGGRTIWIHGLRGSETFKTGQRIRKGDPIGRMGYSYYKIREPSIFVSVSKYGKSDDPMTPFGLKSSFIPPTLVPPKPIASLTQAQAREDFRIVIEALKELYPGLPNVVTEQELQQFVNTSLAHIDSYSGNIPFRDFRDIIAATSAKVHDSHIWFREPEWYFKQTAPTHQPKIRFGWINDTLVCTNALKEYEPLIGQEIIRVNGRTADSMRQIIAAKVGWYDAGVRSRIDYVLATTGFLQLFNPPHGDGSFDMSVEFASGEKLELKGEPIANGSTYVRSWERFERINNQQNSYGFRFIGANTAYLGFSHLSLNDTQMEDIARYIRSIADRQNLIIDLRNNGGGEEEIVPQLFSYIASDTLRLNGYKKVNKKGGFESFNYSLNYGGIKSDIFGDYVEEPGKKGYYCRLPEGQNTIVPDTMTHFKGNVYVLINERSASAAAQFPAMVLRSGRGVLVGRETQTAYHFMNALKFAEIRLPHSTIVFRIPLVEIVFDTLANERVPYGRGVIPDHTVPITLDELSYAHGDAILNYTLDLIKEGQNMPQDTPFAGGPKTPGKAKISQTGRIVWISGSAVLLLAILIGVVRYRKRKNKKTEDEIKSSWDRY